MTQAVLVRANRKLETLWRKFRSKAFRESFVASHISSNIANQIATMREDRGWTQEELAAKAGMRQSRISALEDPSLGSVTLTTLKRIAKAFDVAVVVRFVRYSDVAAWAAEPSPEKISVPSFDEDRLQESMPIKLEIHTAGAEIFTWINNAFADIAGENIVTVGTISDEYPQSPPQYLDVFRWPALVGPTPLLS